MQPVGDYLKKLLYHYDCVVVPTLGAFLTHSVSASFNESTGQFLPPRRKVAFNGALVLDDGILLNYIMLHEGFTREQALEGIHAFVTNLKQQVRQQGSFAIDGLGMFSYNAESSLQFDPELRHNFLSSTYGLQPVMLANRIVHLAQPVGVRKALPVAEVRQPTTALTVINQTQTTAVATEDGLVMPMPVRRRAVGLRWAAAAMLAGTIGFISYFSIVNPDQSLQSSLNPAALFRLPFFLTEKVVKPAVVNLPVKVAPKAAVVTAEPALVGAPKPTVAAPAVVANVPAKLATSPVAVKKVMSAKAIAPVAVSKLQVRTPFTVIAASFASRRNAVRFQKTLVKAGYSDAYIMPGRGLIKVAAIGTQSLAEAESGADSLNALTGIKPFIMRNR